MRISANWLRSLTQIDVPVDELAERLTRAGVEVEAVERVGEGLDRIVVGAVKSCRPHPERDKLVIVEVDDGTATRTVVCGAPNVPRPPGRVALALEGARVPRRGLPGVVGDLVVARRRFAGIESDGMICSEAELGIGPDAEGILVLDDGAGKPPTQDPSLAPGQPLAQALHLVDHILVLGLTPNRGDCLGHTGVAREVSALFGRPWVPPEPSAPQRADVRRIDEVVSVAVEDAERCPRYAAAAVVSLTIAPSPFWLRYRLFTLGIRPISNVVDVTNLVLLEFGQPLHAFDLDRLAGPRIVVRRARPAETMQTLDGIGRQLTDDDLLICDAQGPVAIAGVMGGAGSEIGPSTKRVLIECAHFEPRGILRTARRLGLHTDSSHRFERGVDPNGVPLALAHAASLMTWLGEGAALPGLIDVYPRPIAPRTLRLRPGRLSKVLGSPVDSTQAASILERLGCTVASRGDDLDVTVPTSRSDISREIDLVEEVARVRGYEAIPTRYPSIRTGPPTPRAYPFRQRARHTLAALGLDEAVSYSFVSPRDLEAFRLPPVALPLSNPLSEERSVMRTSLLPGLCRAVARARRVREERVRLFEVGRVFLGWEKPGAATPAREKLWAALVMAGPRDAYLERAAEVDFFDAKGLAIELCRDLTGVAPSIRLCSEVDRLPWLHPRSACVIEAAQKVVGRVGELHPDVIESLDLGGPVAVVEADLDALRTVRGERRFAPLPRFPAVSRDVALLVDESVRAADITRVVGASSGELLESIELFDVYRGEQIPPGKKSLALSIRYRAADRTLTDAEVDSLHATVLGGLVDDLGGQPR
ncbi:MAG: phenylalanine--tRNA ligase subunit beta [Deltaproteobacteria bacterium]|nr:phenylalanine--tRNA ligase subunit beta [Deltaproteobacteria bacterium]